MVELPIHHDDREAIPSAVKEPQEIKDNGLNLPGFDDLTYLETVRRPHGTGVGTRRLGRVADEDIIDKAVEEADKKWDPENHPSSLVPSKSQQPAKSSPLWPSY